MKHAACRALVAALPSASILVVDPGGLAPFGPAKWAAVTTLVLVLAACILHRRSGLARLPMLLWAGFLAVACVAAVAGLDPLYAWTGTPERHLGVFAWVLCAAAFATGGRLDRDERRSLAFGLAFASGVVGLWAIAEALGWEPIALVGTGDRSVGTLGSSAYLGAALALLCPAVTGLAVVRRSAWISGAAGVAWVALVLSGARAAWVGVLVAVLAVGFRRRPPLRRLAPPLAVAAIVLVTVALASGAAGRVPNLVRDREGGARGRLDEWRVATRVIAHHPLLGVGPEGYRIDFGRHVDDAYEQRHARAALPDRAHSAPLDVAATTGLVGAGLYLALLAVVGFRLWAFLQDADPWRAGLATGLLAYGVQSLFLFPVPELDPLAWLLAGTILATGGRKGHLTPSSQRTRYAVAALAGIAAVVAMGAGILDVVADRRAKAVLEGRSAPGSASDLRPDALRYHLADARALEAAGTLTGALEAIESALDRSPRDPVARGEEARLLLARARATTSESDIEAARRALERLAGDDPRNAEVLLRLGLVRMLDGDEPGAQAAWLRAEHLAPTSAAASVNLATLHASAGRTLDAGAAARRALERDPNNRVASEILDGTWEPDR